MLFIANYSKLKEYENLDDYLLVSISRTVPEGFNGLRYEPLYPSSKLLNDYKFDNNIKWTEYRERYHSETLSKLNPNDVLQWLYAMKMEHNKKHVVLLCYCNSNKCHRYLVSYWLNQNGAFIRELR